MTARFSTKTAQKVEYSLYLVFKEDGSVRLTRGSPSCGRDERAMSVLLTVPRSVFRTPTLAAAITLQDVGQQSPHIDVTAATEALRGALGVDIDLRIVEPDR